jgi:hypothetical protein
MHKPYMHKVEHHYGDEQLLKDRYRTIKKFMIGLLHGQKLPLRIPRMMCHPTGAGFHNRIVSEQLFNISYLYDLLDSPLQSKRYGRAAYSIDSLGDSIKPIVFQNDLGYIKGINPEIEGIIRDILVNGRTTLYEELEHQLNNDSGNG